MKHWRPKDFPEKYNVNQKVIFRIRIMELQRQVTQLRWDLRKARRKNKKLKLALTVKGGDLVRVDSDRYRGLGIAQNPPVIAVKIENGNIWDYPVETVQPSKEIDKWRPPSR